jgi:tetratricopeptide (TPR) repeat protein
MAGDPQAKKDFFISYNKADREWAEWIAWHLEESGHYSVLIQAWDFGPGGSFVVEMDRALRECDRVVAVLSPDYLTSLFTKIEWAAYFAQDVTGEKGRIVPVRVRECEPTGPLASIEYLDLVGKPENDAKTALLAAVKIRRKPTGAPSFPARAERAFPTGPRFPNALPETWNVPHLRNPNFTEAGESLAALSLVLHADRRVAVIGLGGVGKTQLVTEYAYRYASDYSLVWWMRSAQPETLNADYAALAAALNIAEKGAAERATIVAAVLQALLYRNDWLLIFEDANGPEDLRNFLPAGRGHVIITSRYADWGGVRCLRVDKWPEKTATEFLLKRTGQSDVASAAALARELDGHPLALDLAARLIDSPHKTLADFLALVRGRQLDLLEHRASSSEPSGIADTVWEAFQRLEKESSEGAALLQLCAFFSPDEIPRDMIAAGAEHLPEQLRETVTNAFAFDEAISALRRYSLIESSEVSTLSMHRLVQAVVRDRLDFAGRQRWAEAAVNVANKAFPFDSDDVRTWRECDRLLPHAIAAAGLAENLNVGLEATSRLMNQIGTYAWGRGEYGKAKAAFERVLRIDELTLGRDHPAVAISVNNTGNALQALGDLSGAKLAFERALEIGERTLDHSAMAISLSNIGSVLWALGDLPRSRSAFERAITIGRNAFGPDHPNVASILNNLGRVLEALGELRGAKTAIEQALEIGEKTLGPDHPNVASIVDNLGRVLGGLGDLAAAKEAFERALTIDEKALGLSHPAIAKDLSNLATVLNALGDIAGAKASRERAVHVLQEALGPDHPSTKRVREQILAMGALGS